MEFHTAFIFFDKLLSDLLFCSLSLSNNSQCAIEYCGIIKGYHTTIGPFFHMYTHWRPTFTIEMSTAEIVTYFVNAHSHFVCNTLRTTTGQFIFDPTQLIECYYHDS